jgi:hypothetical protein
LVQQVRVPPFVVAVPVPVPPPSEKKLSQASAIVAAPVATAVQRDELRFTA